MPLGKSPAQPGDPSYPRWLVHALYALAFGLPLLVLSFTVAQPWWSPGDLLRDPLDVARARVIANGDPNTCCRAEVGAVSLLGNLLTSGASAAMAFAALVRRLSTGRVDGGTTLLALGGLLCAIMVLDDTYRIHEETSQKAFVLVYITLLGAVGFLSFQWLGPFERRFLYVLLAFFIVSIIIDRPLKDHFGEYRVVLEDGAKLIGLCSLVSFAIVAGLRLAVPGLSGAQPGSR